MILRYHKQQKDYTCGPACVKMILGSMGIKKSEAWIARAMKTSSKNGTGMSFFCKLARKMGMKAFSNSNSSISEIKNLLKKHFVIVCYYYVPEKTGHYAIVRKISSGKIFLIDPWCGPKHIMGLKEFGVIWHSTIKRGMKRKWFCAIEK